MKGENNGTGKGYGAWRALWVFPVCFVLNSALRFGKKLPVELLDGPRIRACRSGNWPKAYTLILPLALYDWFVSSFLVDFAGLLVAWRYRETMPGWLVALCVYAGSFAVPSLALRLSKAAVAARLCFWYSWHSSCREGTLGYYIISAKGVRDDKSQRFSITMDSDENDVASQLYRTALKDHGIPYRYEESLTRNGMVTWRPSRQREVLGKSSDAEEEQKPARRFRNALGIVW